jgi:DNA-binding NarL/FixJ family response regulator
LVFGVRQPASAPAEGFLSATSSQKNLVLLDLRMPGMGGYGVLRWLRTHPEIELYVVVLSSVQCSKEIDVVYELGARFFWAKSDCDKLRDRVRDLKESWHCLN